MNFFAFDDEEAKVNEKMKAASLYLLELGKPSLAVVMAAKGILLDCITVDIQAGTFVELVDKERLVD